MRITTAEDLGQQVAAYCGGMPISDLADCRMLVREAAFDSAHSCGHDDPARVADFTAETVEEMGWLPSVMAAANAAL